LSHRKEESKHAVRPVRNTVRKVAAPTLHRIFVQEDPFGQPFAPGVQERRLLYPVSTSLDGEAIVLMRAILASAKLLGDHGVFISVPGRPPEKERRWVYHWNLDFSEMEGYLLFDKGHFREHRDLHAISSLGHIVYSPAGQWAVMLCREDHALLGGSTRFFETLQGIIPGFDDLLQIQEFLSDWKQKTTRKGANVSWIVTWVPALLTHVYGADTAQRLMEQANFAEPL
jgi:hypothetical protein